MRCGVAAATTDEAEQRLAAAFLSALLSALLSAFLSAFLSALVVAVVEEALAFLGSRGDCLVHENIL
ncbi:MAG: hypothetical protein ABI333_13460 [bacterium]